MTKATIDREGWLTSAAGEILESIIIPALTEPHLHKVQESLSRFRVSVGFAKGRESQTPSALFEPRHSADDHAEIFINPRLTDPQLILRWLTHELTHVAVGRCANDYSGHRGLFAHVAACVGFKSKSPAQAAAGPYLRSQLTEIADMLGPYPHATLDPKANRGKGRMVRFACTSCAFIGYTSRKWADHIIPSSHCPVCHSDDCLTTD